MSDLVIAPDDSPAGFPGLAPVLATPTLVHFHPASTPPVVFPAPSPAVLDGLARLQAVMSTLPQTPLPTEHLLHGGMYARTIRRDFDSVTIGSLINKATILIVHGPCSMLIGDRRVDLNGYNVLAGLPGRKSFSIARGPVEMTMICPTLAQTVAEAEDEIFAEADLLVSRRDGNPNQSLITDQQVQVEEGRR